MPSSEPPPVPAGFLLAETAARFPDLPAIVTTAALHGTSTGERTISYRELDRRTAAVARALLATGVPAGGRVALRLAPTVDYPILLLALMRAGLVAVPVSTRIPEATIPALLAGIGCRRLILPAASPRPPGGVAVLAAPELLRAPAREADAPPFDPAGDATIIFTSGSSGRPKAALHAYANHWYSAAGSNRNIPVGPGQRWLLSLPLWHVGGIAILFRAFLGGGAVAIPTAGEPLSVSIRSLGVTHLSLVSTQLLRLLRESGGADAPARLRAVLLGGSALPPPLVAEAHRRRFPLFTSYGSTEMSSQVTATGPDDPIDRLLSSGRVLPFREGAIAPDGEILVRGETLFRGYVTGDALDPARDASGWFPSGDLGRIDLDGFLHVTGRRDAMFVSGGENIQPEEIERELCRFPGVAEAVVVPVENLEFGARPVAFLRSEGGMLPEREALDAFLRETLPGFMIPERYLPWPEGEEGMKPRRRDLAARARSR